MHYASHPPNRDQDAIWVEWIFKRNAVEKRCCRDLPGASAGGDGGLRINRGAIFADGTVDWASDEIHRCSRGTRRFREYGNLLALAPTGQPLRASLSLGF